MLKTAGIMHDKYRYSIDSITDKIRNTRNKSYILPEEYEEYKHYCNFYKFINSLYKEIKLQWKIYKDIRSEIIKQLEYGKYEILLRSVFCYDVKTLILSFMFK